METENKPEETPEEEKRDEDPASSEAPEMVKRAEKAAALMKEEREKMEKVNAETQKLQAFKALGGTTEGGVPAKEKEEVSDTDYANGALEGKIL